MDEFVLTREQIDPNVIEFYEKNYDLIACDLLNQKEDTHLGCFENRKCRFCGKVEGETTFNERAHVFPEAIGNYFLLSWYECDSCNKRFSRNIESNYTNFFKFFHNAFGVRGKKTIPTHQSKDQKSKSQWIRNKEGEKKFIMTEPSGRDSVEIDLENNTILKKGYVDTFIPVAVYKCLVKMAISVMPDKELKMFNETIKWILDIEHKNIFEDKKLLCRYEMIPGYNTTKCPCYSIYRRKEMKYGINGIYPYMLFNIVYGNLSMFIEVPTKLKRSCVDITMIPYPLTIFKTTTKGIYDFSSTDEVKDKVMSVEYTFDKAKELNMEDDHPMDVQSFIQYVLEHNSEDN